MGAEDGLAELFGAEDILDNFCGMRGIHSTSRSTDFSGSLNF